MLPKDKPIRTLICSQILRVAVLNNAAYEWMQHEPVGRECGLTTAQLTIIRNAPTSILSSPHYGSLSPLQAVALSFTDASTRDIRVSREVFEKLEIELKAAVVAGKNKDYIHSLLVEATMVISSYNMVSRLLTALDVGGAMNKPVPYPKDS